MRCSVLALAVITAVAGAAGGAQAGSFTFIDEFNPDRVVHPEGYVAATGGSFEVTICIDPTSANAAGMEIPMQNIAHTMTQKLATTGNIVGFPSTNVPSTGFDFESVALHELGHCVGLGHPNLPSLSFPDNEFAASADGADDNYDLDPGSDLIRGTDDDLRDDDVNFLWFFKTTNDPFSTQATVDSSTYSRLLADLPAGHTFAAAALTQVGPTDTTSVMQSPISNQQDIRTLSADEVSTLNYGMSGLDEIQGTSDDYTFAVSYVGQTTSCDVVFDFDATKTTFAVCSVSASSFGNHRIITSGNVYFSPTIPLPGYSWFFNPVLTAPAGVPVLPRVALVVLLVGITLLLALVRRRRV